MGTGTKLFCPICQVWCGFPEARIFHRLVKKSASQSIQAMKYADQGQNEVALPRAIRHYRSKTADSRVLDLPQQTLGAFLGAATDVRQNRP